VNIQPHLIEVKRRAVVDDLYPEENEAAADGLSSEGFVAEEVEEAGAGLLDLLVVLLDLEDVVEGEWWSVVDLGDLVEELEGDGGVLGDHEFWGLDEVEEKDVED
jgi:hypothetical protein